MAVNSTTFNTRNAVAVPQGKPHAPSYPDLPKEVHPEMQRAHRVALDMIYDMQQGIRAMAGGATAMAQINAGVVSKIIVAFPGFGYFQAPQVTITGGGGTGATASATVANGRLTGITITAGGAGYATPPDVTIVDGNA